MITQQLSGTLRVLTGYGPSADISGAYANRPIYRLVRCFAGSNIIGKFYGPQTDEEFARPRAAPLGRILRPFGA